MRFTTILKNPAEWMEHSGPHHDIVMTSRIRLARNLTQNSFPGWARKEERQKVMQIIKETIEEFPEMQEAFSHELSDLNAIEKQILVERHLISREHAARSGGSATIINRPQTLSLMVNEEDHLRMQSIQAGFRLKEAHGLLNKIDKQLEKKFTFSFNEELGYLTACPSNIGTGMRASAMLHLPGLVLSDLINKTINACNNLGMAVRGIYGEGTEALANLFQISNQSTLGERENGIIQRLEKVVLHIVESERDAREKLLKERPTLLYDHIGRAYGMLSHSHLITTKEAFNHLSMLRLGADLGFLPESAGKKIDQLLIDIQPAHLQNKTKKSLDPNERDICRASALRENLQYLSPPNFYIEEKAKKEETKNLH